MFDTNEFIDFVQEVNSGNDFSKEMLKYIISYGLENKNNSKDQLAYFLSDIIPFISFEEVIMFVDDKILTSDSIKTKYEILESNQEA